MPRRKKGLLKGEGGSTPTYFACCITDNTVQIVATGEVCCNRAALRRMRGAQKSAAQPRSRMTNDVEVSACVRFALPPTR
jgi:hypothetical protein